MKFLSGTMGACYSGTDFAELASVFSFNSNHT
jgi:hypothetical protein